MNDCFWNSTGACDCNTPSHSCEFYVSMNSEKGGECMEEYQIKIDKAIEPVREQLKADFEVFKNDKHNG